jgi:hypothetical protein
MMDLIQKIHRSSLVVLTVLAAISVLIDWKILPLSILTGGILGLLNIRGLAWSVQGLLGTDRAGAKMLFFSQFRLVMLFILLIALVYLKLVNVFGILAGLTVVFGMVLFEGFRYSRSA